MAFRKKKILFYPLTDTYRWYILGTMKNDELKRWRAENGYSQAKLANVLGVASMTVTRWEMGIRSIPPYLHLALKALEGNDKGTKGQKTKKKGKENRRHGKYL